MHSRLELVLKALILHKNDLAPTPGDDELIIAFIERQIQLIKEGK